MKHRGWLQAATALIVLAVLAAPIVAQNPEEAEVYRRDEDLQDRAEALARSARSGDSSLADRTLTYDPEGRRDPFRPLVGVAAEPEEQRGRLPGIAGLRYEELQLVGIIQSSEGDPVAIFFGGPDDKGYFVREGMNFWNGSVHQISAVTNTVIIRQRVEDAGPLPYRDVDVMLYPNEDDQR